MSNRASIVEKIRKLLEHSVENGATEAEAVIFALKAQKLIAEYDVKDWELGEKCEKVIFHTCSEPSLRTWRGNLARVIADNFRCGTYGTYRYKKRVSVIGYSRRERGVPHVVFVGYANDAQAASMVFQHLYKTGDRLARECRRVHNGWSYAYDNYVQGFVEGVRRELEKQSQALMLVIPQAVKDEMEGMHFYGTMTPRSFQWDADIHEEGRIAGQDAVRAGRIEQSEEHLLVSA